MAQEMRSQEGHQMAQEMRSEDEAVPTSDQVRDDLGLSKHLGLTSENAPVGQEGATATVTGTEQAPFSTRLWNGISSLKDTVISASSVASGAVAPQTESPFQQAKESVEENRTSSGEAEAKPKDMESTPSAELPDQETVAKEGKTWSQWAADRVKGVAQAASSKGLSEQLQAERTAAESADSTTKAADSATTTQTESATITPTESATKPADSKSWTQWATDNVSKVKDVAASKLPIAGRAQTSPGTEASSYDVATGDKKSLAQSVVEKGLGVKDTLASKIGIGANKASDAAGGSKAAVQDVVNRYSTSTRTPETGQKSVTKTVIDTGLGLKDGIASQLGYGPSPDTSAGARAAAVRDATEAKAAAIKEATTSRIGNMKRSTVAVLTPGEGEKDLSKSITESLSNLPAMLKQKLTISSSQNTETSTGPDSPSTAPRGIASRVTGVVSSYIPASVSSYLPGQKTSDKKAGETSSRDTVVKGSSEPSTGSETTDVLREAIPEPETQTLNSKAGQPTEATDTPMETDMPSSTGADSGTPSATALPEEASSPAA